MTPAIQCARRAKINFHIHQYSHDPDASSYGEEAAEKLAIPVVRVFKTLVVLVEKGSLAVAVVPVSHQLSFKAMAVALRAKKVGMAEPAAVERSTGYVLGGVSPLGQKKPLPTVIDASAEAFPTIFVSAGKRGVEIELSPEDLAKLCNAGFAEIAADL